MENGKWKSQGTGTLGIGAPPFQSERHRGAGDLMGGRAKTGEGGPERVQLYVAYGFSTSLRYRIGRHGGLSPHSLAERPDGTVQVGSGGSFSDRAGRGGRGGNFKMKSAKWKMENEKSGVRGRRSGCQWKAVAGGSARKSHAPNMQYDITELPLSRHSGEGCRACEAG